MKYKAKASYRKLDDSKNFYAFQDSSKHNMLMAGGVIEMESVPKELEKHLESAEPKKEKEDK
jgi:hypothetical protein|tara:strand:+ start:31 stop:216 length:186 start_codon:yes stop_codon:yes gene_type:complete